jgi:hypothetical protein
MIGDIMVQPKRPENGYQSRFRKNNVRTIYWSIAWAAADLLMAFGPKFLWKALVFTLLAVGLNVAVGAGMVLAYKKYILELDDLQRMVQLNALAITVGVAVVVGTPYWLMSKYHVIPIQADTGHMVGLMALTYAVSVAYGNLRYCR